MNHDLTQRIKQTLIEALMLDLAPDDLGEDEDLSDRLGVDSVGFLEILTALEEEFGVTIQDVSVNRRTVGTVRKLGELVQRCGAAGAVKP